MIDTGEETRAVHANHSKEHGVPRHFCLALADKRTINPAGRCCPARSNETHRRWLGKGYIRVTKISKPRVTLPVLFSVSFCPFVSLFLDQKAEIEEGGWKVCSSDGRVIGAVSSEWKLVGCTTRVQHGKSWNFERARRFEFICHLRGFLLLDNWIRADQ